MKNYTDTLLFKAKHMQMRFFLSLFSARREFYGRFEHIFL